MASDLTYRQLLREVRHLAREVGRDTQAHQQIASAITQEALDIARIAEQIAALDVDTGTVAETRELSLTMRGMSEAATRYVGAAQAAGQQAQAAEQQAQTDHNGIQEAADRSPVPMANRTWYTQE